MTDNRRHPRKGLRRPDDAVLKTSALWCLGWLVGLATTAAVLGHLLAPDAMPMTVSSAEDPPAGYYLAHGRSGHTDHHVLYHGLDPTSNERLDTADVLWLGNSRLLFALDRQVLRNFFTPRGLTYFMLGFGHDETFHFPVSILEQRALRPKLVVVNVDDFFVGPPSEWAQRVATDSRFDAWKWWFETEAAHAVRGALHAWLPHWPDILSGQQEFVIYRSQLDGTWFVGSWRSDVGPLPVSTDETKPTADRIANARAFVERMRGQGTAVIFCLVPSPTTSRETAEELARAVGVPLVAPELEAPLTIDGSHLTEESASEYADLLMKALSPHLNELGF